MPLVVVAVAYMVSARLTPAPANTSATKTPAEAPIQAPRTALLHPPITDTGVLHQRT